MVLIVPELDARQSLLGVVDPVAAVEGVVVGGLVRVPIEVLNVIPRLQVRQDRGVTLCDNEGADSKRVFEEVVGTNVRVPDSVLEPVENVLVPATPVVGMRTRPAAAGSFVGAVARKVVPVEREDVSH